MRLMDRMPPATPAFATWTEFIAAVDIGDITRPIPRPMTENQGSR